MILMIFLKNLIYVKFIIEYLKIKMFLHVLFKEKYNKKTDIKSCIM